MPQTWDENGNPIQAATGSGKTWDEHGNPVVPTKPNVEMGPPRPDQYHGSYRQMAMGEDMSANGETPIVDRHSGEPIASPESMMTAAGLGMLPIGAGEAIASRTLGPYIVRGLGATALGGGTEEGLRRIGVPSSLSALAGLAAGGIGERGANKLIPMLYPPLGPTFQPFELKPGISRTLRFTPGENPGAGRAYPGVGMSGAPEAPEPPAPFEPNKVKPGIARNLRFTASPEPGTGVKAPTRNAARFSPPPIAPHAEEISPSVLTEPKNIAPAPVSDNSAITQQYKPSRTSARFDENGKRLWPGERR